MALICVGDLTIIGSDNGLSPGRRQDIIRTNAEILLIALLETNFIETQIKILTFSFKKMRLNMSSAIWRPLCLGLNELKRQSPSVSALLRQEGTGPGFTNGFATAIQISFHSPRFYCSDRYKILYMEPHLCSHGLCKNGCDLMASIGITARRSLHHICIVGKSWLVKRGLYQHSDKVKLREK